MAVKTTQKVTISIVSLLACLAGSTIFGAAAVVKATQQPQHQSQVQASQVSAVPLTFNEFKLQPRLNLWGYSGNKTLGQGQALVPFYGDQSRVLYGLAEGNAAINDSSWLAGGGLGYRQVVNNERIYGGYMLVDYNNTPENNGFWMANPGVEMLGQVWDANINGYIPINDKKTLGKLKLADDFIGTHDKNFKRNPTDYIRYTGNKEYAHQFQLTEETGRGFDFEVGRVIPHFEKAKLYLGAYHFDTSDSGSENGIEARVTYELNHYAAVELENTNDNVNHNKLLFGVRLTFGGNSDEEKQKLGISSRLLDPIDHDFAVLNASSTAVKSIFVDKGETLEHDNIWFFKPKAGDPLPNTNGADTVTGKGTFEDPFIGLTQANKDAIIVNIGKIDLYPLMYFASGTYNLSDYNSVTMRFDLPNGWGMYGRMNNYAEPAMKVTIDGSTVDNRAQFLGGIDLNYALNEGNNQTTLNSIRVSNAKGAMMEGDFTNAALYAENARNVVLQNTEIANNVDVPAGSADAYAYGIYANNSHIAFNGGTNIIKGNSNGIDSAPSANAYGIYAENNSDITFDDGHNEINGTIMGCNNASRNGYGIYITTNSHLTFNGGTNIISGNGGFYDGNSSNESVSGYGIYASGSSVTFNGGINTISGVGTSNSAGPSNGYGIKVVDDSTVRFLNLNKDKITINVNGKNVQYGIYADESSLLKDAHNEYMEGYVILRYVSFGAHRSDAVSGTAGEWVEHEAYGWPVSW